MAIPVHITVIIINTRLSHMLYASKADHCQDVLCIIIIAKTTFTSDLDVYFDKVVKIMLSCSPRLFIFCVFLQSQEA
jgi:hypothetical protein